MRPRRVTALLFAAPIIFGGWSGAAFAAFDGPLQPLQGPVFLKIRPGFTSTCQHIWQIKKGRSLKGEFVRTATRTSSGRGGVEVFVRVIEDSRWEIRGSPSPLFSVRVVLNPDTKAVLSDDVYVSPGVTMTAARRKILSPPTRLLSEGGVDIDIPTRLSQGSRIYQDVGLRQFAEESLQAFAKGTRLTSFRNNKRVIGTTKSALQSILLLMVTSPLPAFFGEGQFPNRILESRYTIWTAGS